MSQVPPMPARVTPRGSVAALQQTVPKIAAAPKSAFVAKATARGYTPSRPGESDNIDWDGWDKNDVTGTSEIWLPGGTVFRGWNKRLRTEAGSGWYESVSGQPGRRIISNRADRFTGQTTDTEASASGSNDMIQYAGKPNDAFSNTKW